MIYSNCCFLHFSPTPNVSGLANYYNLMLTIGLVHNFFSLVVLISYFLSNHPKLPSVRRGLYRLRYIMIYFKIRIHYHVRAYLNRMM